MKESVMLRVNGKAYNIDLDPYALLSAILEVAEPVLSC